ncbi:MAG: TspO/MBR family protein [Chitinophagaceae bacterium]
MKLKQPGTLVLCILLTVGTGALSGYLTGPEIDGWYAGLEKPSFNPPNYIFGPVWTTLYLLMGISLYLVVIRSSAWKKMAIAAFVVQLVLNFFWSIIFFNLHDTGFALIEIGFLWVSILFMILMFYRIHRPAAFLQIPYLLWVSFASILNAAIHNLN